jgi:ubiquitin carboxyl-terminal hydrolase 25/28
LYAFARQNAVDLENRSYYYECLKAIAVGRKSEALGMHVAMLGSQGFNTKSDVNAAYWHFGINPAHVMHINDEHIVGVFKSRLSDEGPSSADMTRTQLRIIGDARNSALLRAEASGALETYQQALSWLDLTEGQADDFVPTMYALKVSLLQSSFLTLA